MISLSYKKSGNRVNLHVENPNRVQIRFSKSLGEILGLNPDLSNKLIGNDNQAFTYAVDLNMTHRQMFVYSNVADYTYVGNITAPLLRIVSYKQSKSSTGWVVTWFLLGYFVRKNGRLLSTPMF